MLQTSSFHAIIVMVFTENLTCGSKITLVQTCPDEQINHLTQELVGEDDYVKWQSLAEVNMARVIMFNKRRSSEVANLKLKTYHNS